MNICTTCICIFLCFLNNEHALPYIAQMTRFLVVIAFSKETLPPLFLIHALWLNVFWEMIFSQENAFAFTLLDSILTSWFFELINHVEPIRQYVSSDTWKLLRNKLLGIYGFIGNCWKGGLCWRFFQCKKLLKRRKRLLYTHRVTAPSISGGYL